MHNLVTQVFEEGASFFQDSIAIGGTLSLRAGVLTFRSHSGARRQCFCEVLLTDIAGIEFFQTLQISPNGLILLLRDGSLRHFVVDDRKKWKARILNAISESNAA